MSVRKVKHIQEKILKPLNARMTRIRKGRAYEKWMETHPLKN